MTIFSTTLFGFLWIVTIVVVWGIKRTAQAIIKDDQYSALLTRFEDWAAIAVRYAKDWGEQEHMSGSDRRRIAVQAMKELRDKLNLDDISDEQIEMLIRAAYTIMVDESEELSFDPDFENLYTPLDS